VHGCTSLSQFLPRDSATLQFLVLMSIHNTQMDAYSKEEQIGTLFVWVGAPEGGFGGWVVGQGDRIPDQNWDVPSFRNFPASCLRPCLIHLFTSFFCFCVSPLLFCKNKFDSFQVAINCMEFPWTLQNFARGSSMHELRTSLSRPIVGSDDSCDLVS
jgi:hypothetical protein